MSETDQWFIDQAHAHEGSVSVVIFRGSNDDGTARWGFDPSLDAHEADALAVELLRGMVIVYGQFFECGICVHAHAEWAPREARAFRHANNVLIEELARELDTLDPDSPRHREAELELWTLRNLTFFFTLGFTTLVNSVLPEKLPMLEMRIDRVRQRLSASVSARGSLLAH